MSYSLKCVVAWMLIKCKSMHVSATFLHYIIFNKYFGLTCEVYKLQDQIPAGLKDEQPHYKVSTVLQLSISTDTKFHITQPKQN